MSRTVQYQLHGSAGRAAGVWHQRINWEIMRREMSMLSETSTVFPVRHSEGARGPWLLVAPTQKRDSFWMSRESVWDLEILGTHDCCYEYSTCSRHRSNLAYHLSA